MLLPVEALTPCLGGLSPSLRVGKENGDDDDCKCSGPRTPTAPHSTGPPCCRKTGRLHASPHGPREAARDRGIALGRCAPTAPVTSALKNSSFSNMLQVPGRYTAASRVSGTSTFLPRRVSFSHSLMFNSKCFTSNGHKMEQTCFPSHTGEVRTKPVRGLQQTGMT